MTDEELRVKALELAVADGSAGRKEEFYRFLTGSSTPVVDNHVYTVHGPYSYDPTSSVFYVRHRGVLVAQFIGLDGWTDASKFASMKNNQTS